METNLVGGWSSFAPVTKEDEKIFRKAMQVHPGANFTPEQVSTQTVSGKNYRFLCKAVSSTNPPREYQALVSFYVNLEGEISNRHVKDLSVDEVGMDNVGGYARFGGYVAHEEITEQDRAVFNYAVKDLLGVEYNLKAVASQVVNGINYKFICVAKVVVPYAQPELVVIEVYTKFRHSVAPIVEIKNITKI